MTNAQIIFNQRVDLMKKGIIGTTGYTIDAVKVDGTIETIMEPVDIHTYQAWKEMGYQVKRGEKAVAKFTIWKYKPGKVEIDSDEEEKGTMFMKLAHFFAENQVEKI